MDEPDEVLPDKRPSPHPQMENINITTPGILTLTSKFEYSQSIMPRQNKYNTIKGNCRSYGTYFKTNILNILWVMSPGELQCDTHL